jgi:glycine cleavage system H protein
MKEVIEMNVPKGLLYTSDHEWVRVEGDRAYVGITDYAQHALGDIVFVELPGEGTEVASGTSFAVVESVKAASDIYAPLSGTVVGVNGALEDTPEALNQNPYENWIVVLELSNKAELDILLSAEAYTELIEKEA